MLVITSLLSHLPLHARLVLIVAAAPIPCHTIIRMLAGAQAVHVSSPLRFLLMRLRGLVPNDNINQIDLLLFRGSLESKLAGLDRLHDLLLLIRIQQVVDVLGIGCLLEVRLNVLRRDHSIRRLGGYFRESNLLVCLVKHLGPSELPGILL